MSAKGFCVLWKLKAFAVDVKPFGYIYVAITSLWLIQELRETCNNTRTSCRHSCCHIMFSRPKIEVPKSCLYIGAQIIYQHVWLMYTHGPQHVARFKTNVFSFLIFNSEQNVHSLVWKQVNVGFPPRHWQKQLFIWTKNTLLFWATHSGTSNIIKIISRLKPQHSGTWMKWLL